MVSEPRVRREIEAVLERDAERRRWLPVAAYVARWPKHAELVAEIHEAMVAKGLGHMAQSASGESVLAATVLEKRVPGPGPRMQLEDSVDPSAEGGLGGFMNRDWIGPYRLLRELGQGAQGIVYLAEDSRLGRRVALKVLKGIGPASEELMLRFQREAEITSRLAHPGICVVYESGILDRMPFIAMRLVEGRSLSRMIHDRSSEIPETIGDFLVNPALGVDTATLKVPTVPVAPGTKAEIDRIVLLFEQVALALHVAHEAGVIHRDIKPGNIMVTENDEPVLMDFGLARDDGDDGQSLTVSGELMGTPAYMSPEHLASQRIALDRRADVYSLGVSLFEALTGRRPFEAPTRAALYQAIMTKAPPNPRGLNQSLSRDLCTVLATTMEKDRDRRYQTSLDLAEDLRRTRALMPIRATRASAWRKLTRLIQRHPGAAIATIVIVALIACAAILSLTLRRVVERNELLEAEKAAGSRLASVARLSELASELQAFWTPNPEELTGEKGVHRWLQHLEDQRVRRFQYVRDLVAARKRSLPLQDSKEEAARARKLAETEDLLVRWLHTEPGSGESSARSVLDALAVLSTYSWEFDDSYVRYTARVLDQILHDIEELETGLPRVQTHARFLETVVQDSMERPRVLWAETRNAIATSPLYRKLQLPPQLGLIPLGQDSESHLFEFAHLQSGEPAQRHPKTRRLLVTESTGIVFVLVPGGRFMMGAQSRSADLENYDQRARPNEGEPHEVALEPFFISKYEMTQAQWKRITGRNPSTQHPGFAFARAGGVFHPSLEHPVETVSWDDALMPLRIMGLELPSESQWEYAARGGSAAPWWVGQNPRDLAGACNLADQSLQQNGGPQTLSYAPFDDGFVISAPVWFGRPNPFGLHGVIGNVFEWCKDPPRQYNSSTVDPGTGLRAPDDEGKSSRVVRGGGFKSPIDDARSSFRAGPIRNFSSEEVGLRPIRLLTRD